MPPGASHGDEFWRLSAQRKIVWILSGVESPLAPLSTWSHGDFVRIYTVCSISHRTV